MSVPANVSGDVPANATAVRTLGRRGKRVSAPRYLTSTPHGWRFQIRIPSALLRQDSFLAGSSPIMIRAQIGWRPKREAERLAMKLAALCQDAFDAGVRAMTDVEEGKGEGFVEQLVGTCNSLIDQMLADPSTAAGIARGLQDTLSRFRMASPCRLFERFVSPCLCRRAWRSAS